MAVGVLTDAFDVNELVEGFEVESRFHAPSAHLPTPEQLAAFELVIVLGRLGDVGAARQLSGIVRLALERSRGTFVFAHPVHLADADAELLRGLGHARWFGNVPNPVFDYPAEFHPYFTEYGMSGTAFYRSDVDAARVIGWIHENDGPRAPAALCRETERFGVIYSLPYYLSPSGSPTRLLTALHTAVAQHREALAIGLPSYLSEVRLGATEENLLAQIAEMERNAAERRAEAARLERWRHLIGRASGTPLVELVVEAMNVVLDGTGYRAEAREDLGAEDFWIVGPDGADVALAEAKGVGGGIARANIGQVDSHREARSHEPEFAGLLVVNTFRNDMDLNRKQSEVTPNVVSLAGAQNVVVMRTWDLYQLVGQKLDGEDVGVQVLAALSDTEGGWLRVDASGADLVR